MDERLGYWINKYPGVKRVMDAYELIDQPYENHRKFSAYMRPAHDCEHVTGDGWVAIGDAAYAAQQAVESKERVVVGVNDFVDDAGSRIPMMTIDESVERDQVARLRAFREKRRGDVHGSLEALDRAAREGANLMPLIVDCVRSDCTVGEIVGTLKKTFGEHTDQGF